MVGVLLGLAFAGSSRELADGARVGGVDVGGLTQRQAVAKLDGLFSEVADDPVTFLAGEKSFAFAMLNASVPITPGTMALQVMPCRAPSIARVRVSPSAPAFVVE